MVRITDVEKHSRADKAGIRSGDDLVSINGREINDVLDFRFYLADSIVTVSVLRNGVIHNYTITKDTYDDIGLQFEKPLMDDKMHCVNKCIFCFIDQLPKGMRRSLYFKDDDSRLSFLHGNYITLTNLERRDIDRIIEMHISPVNISVHTTDPELRRKMMLNPRAGEVLSYLDVLHDAGVKMRGQIVLCRGINDKENLIKTMSDLAGLYPEMESVSIVPAGLTAYRDGLYQLEPFTPEECAAVIDDVTAFSDECLKKYGSRIFFASDEFYVKSGKPLPPYEYWEEFTQIENGVGMLSSFEHEFMTALLTLDERDKETCREVSVATGEASYEMILKISQELMQVCKNISVHVHKIKNNFFGGEVTVTGLLTGKDLYEQLSGKDLGEELLLSRSMLRSEGDLFLCGETPEGLSEKLGIPIRFTENDGADFLFSILGE
ncbi:MAG: DUF512 domain-containing protein [Clostridia bacterium]|nr:DUF512 domain-containing protein [Clostridia bacterium]